MLLAALAALITRMVLRAPDQVASRQEAVQEQLFTYGNATAQVLRMRGYKVQPGETPMLFARRMDKLNAGGVPITPLWRAMTLSNYSRRNPTQKLSEQAKEIFHSVYQPQPFYVKLRFLLAAAFGKNFYRMLETPVEHVEPKKLYELPKPKDGGRKKGKNPPKPPAGKAQQERRMQEHAEIDRSVQESLSQPEMPVEAHEPTQRPEAYPSSAPHEAHTLSRGERIGALQRQQLNREQSTSPGSRQGSAGTAQDAVQRPISSAGNGVPPSPRTLQPSVPMRQNPHPHAASEQPEVPVRRRRRQD